MSIDRSSLRPIRRGKPWFKRPWVWVVALAALGISAVLARSLTAPPQVELTTVATAYPSQSLAILNATGRVTASTRASVSSKATGRLEWLGVVEGQKVNQGDVIARLEARDVSAQREQSAAGVEAARANLSQGMAELINAEADMKRAQDLSQRGFVSSSSVDQAQARVNKARASTQALQAQISVSQANLKVAGVSVEQTLIRAPFTGVVLTKSANVGDIVTPFSSAVGTTGAVVTMADMRTLEVEADVSETSIAKVRVGQPIEIQLDAYPELRLAGSVSRIVPTVDRSKATLLVKIKFEETDARVLPDMSAKVAFLTRPLRSDDRAPVPAVRPEAVVKRSIDGTLRDVAFVAMEPGAGTGTGTGAAGAAANEGSGDTKGGNSASAAAASPPATPASSSPSASPAPSKLIVRRVQVNVLGKVGDLLRVDTLAAGMRVVMNPTDKLADGATVVAVRK